MDKNESSAQMSKEFAKYCKQYEAMEAKMKDKDKTIERLKAETEKLKKQSSPAKKEEFEKLKREYNDLLTTSKAATAEKERTIQSLGDKNRNLEKQSKDLKETLADLKKQLGKRPRDVVAVVEVAKIGNLYEDLTEFQRRIEAALEAALATPSEREAEIETMKKSNGEMFARARDGPARARVLELSAELEAAEAELRRRRADAQRDGRKAALRVGKLKEKMDEGAEKFGATVDKGAKELRKHLHANRKELDEIEREVKAGNDNTLIYEKVKNVLLQQENLLMKEMYSSMQGPSGDAAVPQFLNNLNPTAFQKQTNVEADFARNVNITSPFEEDDEENPFDDDDDFDDVVSEAGSINSKRFKLVLQNVVEGGKKSDEEKVQMVLRELTGLDLSDIEVRRLGKPIPLKPRPVLVCFTTLEHVREILKKKKSLLNTKYKDVTVYAYRKRTNANNPNTNNPNANNPNANKPKPKGSRNKGKASPFD